jgi:hypothetical protein
MTSDAGAEHYWLHVWIRQISPMICGKYSADGLPE